MRRLLLTILCLSILTLIPMGQVAAQEPEATHPGLSIHLLEGANVLPYMGATAPLPEALRHTVPHSKEPFINIWVRNAGTDGEWLYYNAAINHGTLLEIKHGWAYIFVSDRECFWFPPIEKS